VILEIHEVKRCNAAIVDNELLNIFKYCQEALPHTKKASKIFTRNRLTVDQSNGFIKTPHESSKNAAAALEKEVVVAAGHLV
jgi:hypothetical protein